MSVTIATLATVSIAYVLCHVCWSLCFGPLAQIPGPKSFALTKFRLAYEDYKGTRTRKFHALHRQYGPVVRVGPNEVTFNSISALRTIYGAGSGFERTSFYDMFEAYGRKNMFTFHQVKEHGDRKKLFAHAYAKSVMLKGENANMIENKARKFLELLEREGRTSEIFSTLHYFSLDNITQFLYGKFGRTACLEGEDKDRALIGDITDSGRRKLACLTVHFPKFTAWFYSSAGIIASIARQFFSVQTQTAYASIRLHALKSFRAFANASTDEKAGESALISKLWKHHRGEKENGLDDLDIAAECADHLLAGMDTTSDTLMFLVWSLSRPEYKRFQQKLIDEVRNIPADSLNSDGIPRTEVCDKLSFVDAVIKETLRLYAPVPSSEPRSLRTTITIDGYVIPAGTVVSISPYVLHRTPDVFKDPLNFNPERWLGSSQDVAEMKKWFWPFSSGGRMCIGMHLAMAEMTTLVAAIYRKYTTITKDDFDVVSPGITSRFEVFYDESCDGMREHECRVEFKPQ